MNRASRTPGQESSEHHAIVIGGSMAGLLAARVLSDHFEHVTIIDRDLFPTTPEHRKGVPQSQHAHTLLAAGQRIIAQLFPGIMAELQAEGAQSVSHVAIVSPAGKLATRKQPGGFIAFSRYLLEWHIRHRLSQQPQVRIIAHTEVTGLLSAHDDKNVIGVQIREREQGQIGATTELRADLVVDASGRHSRIAHWLTEIGYQAAPEEVINSGLGYASRFYARPANFPDEWQGLIINGRPPHNARAGLILPIENERWHVSLGGFAGHFPPADEEGFLQWARDLPDPSIYEALRVAQPLTPIRAYRTPENQFRHFEQLERWPGGLIVIGDAICAFNPIYGQGMTVSALSAMTLNACLQEQPAAAGSDFAQHFQQQLAATVADAWLVATSEDLRWPGVTLRGARPQPGLALLHRYMNLVLYSAVTDVHITQAYLAVIMMTDRPRSLFKPAILTRVFLSALRRKIQSLFTHQHETDFALTAEAIKHLQSIATVDYEQAS